MPSSSNKGRNAGLVIKEQLWAEVDGERVRDISDKWKKAKNVMNKHELHFMTWPIHFGDEWGQRKFYVYDKQGRMLAYMFWMPSWRDGKVVGYTSNVLRYDPDKSLGPSQGYVLDFAFFSCVDIFRREVSDSFAGRSCLCSALNA